MSVYTKLMAIQSDLKAPKGQYNKFGNYSYRSCEDILEAVKPLLKAHGCVLILSDSMEWIDGRHYVKAVAKIIDSESNETVENSSYAREPASKKGMDESQITGTASSYARKYALNGLFCIDDTKDADTDEYHVQQTKQQSKTSSSRQSKTEYKELSLPPQQEEPAPICTSCGKPVSPSVGKNGKSYTAKQVYKLCGGLCSECFAAKKGSTQ